MIDLMANWVTLLHQLAGLRLRERATVDDIYVDIWFYMHGGGQLKSS